MTKVEQPVIGMVNDEAAVTESLRFLLEVAGHAVETFASAADLLKGESHELACVIVDHHLPHMTGLELAERLRADGSGVPIILITGSPSPTTLLRTAEIGIDRVLEKPADYEDLHNFADVTRSRGSSPYPPCSGTSDSLVRGLPIFLRTGNTSAGPPIEPESDCNGWYEYPRNIAIFLCSQFLDAQPNRSNETEVTSKMAAEPADSHGMPTNESEAVSADLAAAASDDDTKPEPAIGSETSSLIGCNVRRNGRSTSAIVIEKGNHKRRPPFDGGDLLVLLVRKAAAAYT